MAKKADVDLGRFLEEEIYPALFSRLDSAFPEFNWERKGRNWEASAWPSGFPLAVDHENADRLYVYADRPWWIKVHGHEGVRLLDYAAGGSKPRGEDFLRAVRKLADLAGLAFPERELSEEEKEAAERKHVRRSALEAVAAVAQSLLFSPEGASALAYLAKRGLSEENVRELGLGYYPTVEKIRAGLSEDELPAAKEAALLWDKLEGYVLFPWADATGQPLTIYGRWASKVAPEGRPKTIALPGEGSKGSPLYFDRARASGHKDLVAVEGVLDAALLQVKGETRAVAYVAAQFSGEQVKTLARAGTRSVVIAPDPDGGGDKGALSSIESLSKAGIRAYVAPRLPDGLDPDEFLLREGLEGWRAHVDRAVGSGVYRAALLLAEVSPGGPAAKRDAAIEEVTALAASLSGDWAEAEREEVLSLLEERTGLTVDALAPLVEAAEEKRRKEEEGRSLADALREAEDRRRKGESPAAIALELRDALSDRLHADAAPPPSFSVDRLLEETRLLPRGLASGWDALDLTGVRFNPGELALVAARTSHGKTSILAGLARNWIEAGAEDELVVFYSHEEPEVRVFHRLLALLTVTEAGGWTANEVRDYLRDPGSRNTWGEGGRSLRDAQDRLRSLEGRLLVVNRPGWDAEALSSHARALAKERPVRAVLVDYLQRVRPPEARYDRRDIEISAVGRSLKALAVDLSVPVVVGAQINREAIPQGYASKIQGKAYREATGEIRKARPELHHLREGGSEQEADLVLGALNYAADYHTEAASAERPPEVTLLEVGVLKNRYGPVGLWAGLAFEGRFNLVRDPSPEEEALLMVETKRTPSRADKEALRREKEAAVKERDELRLQTALAKAKAEEEKNKGRQLDLERTRVKNKATP